MMRARLLVPFIAVLLLNACSDDPADKITGTRIAVLTPAAKLAPDSSADETITVPEAVANDAWPQAMGKPDGTLGNMVLDRKLDRKWSASVGEGGDGRTKLMARPVVAGGVVYTLDTAASARAFSLKDGEVLWTRDLAPEDTDEDQFGGGVAVDDGHVYATTGYGEVISIEAATGKVEWRSDVRDVVRSAPMVYQGRVFAMTVMGQLYALNATTGQVLWTHSGISESSAILGSSTPVITGDVVIAPYNSGELYAVRVQNGRTVWSQSLAGSQSRGAAPAMSDIKSSPAIDGDRVYAISHGGRMAAIDIRTGGGAWDADLAGIDTPILAGDVVYVLAESNTLVALDRADGRVKSVKELGKFEDDDSTEAALRWTGPVLGGGALWVANNMGQLVGIDPTNNSVVYDEHIGGSISLAPIVAQGTLLVLNDDGDLAAYR